MSCIVGLVHNKRVYIGCDSLGSDEFCKMTRNDTKVFHVSGRTDACIGFAGSFRMGQLLRYSEGLIDVRAKSCHKYIVTKVVPRILDIFDKGGFTKTEDGGTQIGCKFLFGFKDQLFDIDNDFQVGENTCGYAAIGEGYSYALGSLYATADFEIKPEERIFMALKAASVFGMGVGAPFHIYNTGNDKIITRED